MKTLPELRRLSHSGLLTVCLAAFSFCAPSTSPALDPARSLFQYNCRTWSRQNGLPANAVNVIRQTPDGYLYLGTPLGLVQFDGIDFKLTDGSHMPSPIVRTLAVSKEGGLWVGLERGAFGYYDGRDFHFRGGTNLGGVNLNVGGLVESGDSLWIAAETGASRVGIRTNSFDDVLSTAVDSDRRYDISAILEDASGRVWLGTVQRGLYCWQDGKLTQFPDRALDDRIIRSLAVDLEGRLWVGTETGLICYDRNLNRTNAVPFPWYETQALHVDKKGAVWAGTSGGGLHRYYNGQLTNFRKADGLADDFVRSIAEDSEGSLWVGTRNGLSQLSDVKIPTIGKSEGLSADVVVSTAPARQGGLWIATDHGFISYQDGRMTNYVTGIGLSDSYVKGIYEAHNGDIYLLNGTMDIEIYSGTNIVAHYQNKTWPTAIAEDDEGVIVAVGGDLFRVNSKSMTPMELSADGDGVALGWIFNMIRARDGSIWASSGNGLAQIRNGKVKTYVREGGTTTANKINWVCEDPEGTIWAGLETGLARCKDGKMSFITRANGLFDNVLYCLVPDDAGYLWAHSSRGFFKVSLKSLNDFVEGRAGHVDSIAYDGLDAVKTAERMPDQMNGCKTADGRIWFPTTLGLAVIDPTNINPNLVPPPVYIQNVWANGRELADKDAAVVRPGKGELEFHYAGLSYVAPQKVQYRYKLDGYDHDWVQAGTRRSAFYTNLKPGQYRFLVQACNADGVWGAATAAYSVELMPHFYQTLLFRISLGILPAVLAVGIYVWRVRHLQRKQRQLQEAHDHLERKVQERTQALAETNSSLKNEIEERKRMEQEVERIHNQLVDASRMAGQAEVASSVLHNVGNVLNSVNVSTTLVAERLQKMRLPNLTKISTLIQENSADLATFFSNDPRGKQLPQYVQELARHLGKEQQDLVAELHSLAHNVEHIKEIVAMQQTYAKVSGAEEKVELADIVDNAIKMQANAYTRHEVKVEREYQPLPPVVIDRHKVLQILINIFQNAKHACDDGKPAEKKVNVRIRAAENDRLQVEVQDNGIGIPPENLTRIFSHGFTTRKEGHGFGLHSSALAAKEMGGSLTALSAGVGKGATFILDLPMRPVDSPRPSARNAQEAGEVVERLNG
ncbi:MAG: two-component regulator propeller domain-containing protein [Verrucomicrobiota bacterium]